MTRYALIVKAAEDGESVRERREIADGPDLAGRGSAGAHEIAQKVDVERQESTGRRESPPPADRRRRSSSQHRPEETMKEDMVVGAIPARLRAAEESVSQIDQSAQAIRIRRHAGPRDGRPFAGRRGQPAAQFPADEQMRDGIHGADSNPSRSEACLPLAQGKESGGLCASRITPSSTTRKTVSSVPVCR